MMSVYVNIQLREQLFFRTENAAKESKLRTIDVESNIASFRFNYFTTGSCPSSLLPFSSLKSTSEVLMMVLLIRIVAVISTIIAHSHEITLKIKRSCRRVLLVIDSI